MALRSPNPMRGGTARSHSRSRSEFGRVVLDVTGRQMVLVIDGFFDAGRSRWVTRGPTSTGTASERALLASPANVTRTGKSP
jgi:hypothetical protein